MAALVALREIPGTDADHAHGEREEEQRLDGLRALDERPATHREHRHCEGDGHDADLAWLGAPHPEHRATNDGRHAPPSLDRN